MTDFNDNGLYDKDMLFGANNGSDKLFFVALVVECFILTLFLVFNTWFFSCVVVNGSSMYPTLHDGDVLVMRLTAKPVRGEIIVIDGEKEIIRDGLPAGIQGALFSLSNMLIQSSIIGFNNELCPGGSDIIDGNAAASSLEAFIYVATNSVYQAAVTFLRCVEREFPLVALGGLTVTARATPDAQQIVFVLEWPMEKKKGATAK